MQKVFPAVFGLVCLLVSSFASADVTIEVTDLEKKIMRVSYSITDNSAGNRSWTWPDNGLTYANSPLQNVSVIEKNTEQELDFTVVNAPRSNTHQALKIEYPNPIPKGGNYKLEVTAEATTEGITVDAKGRYVFRYSTGHIAFFVLPKGHAIVYSNYPILVYEKKGRTVVQVKDPGTKDLLFKTRAFTTN